MTTDAIWAAFGGRLRGFIAKRVREEVDIDDLLQDVFVKIHAGLRELKEEEKLEAWLFQVARRAVVDHYRRRRAVALPADLAERTPSKDVAAELASCLEPLIPEEDREALRIPRKDLAGRLGLSVSGAKSRVQRARARLQEALLECCHLEMDGRGRPVDYRQKRGDCACSTEGGPG